MDRVIAASTHPWAYKLHKYWARKPHNVISQLVAELTPNGGSVVDPFCGSGVILREAGLLGRGATGFDVNPVAVLLSDVTIRPPDPSAFREILAPILTEVSGASNSMYGQSSEGFPLRFVVHEMTVECQTCGYSVGSTEAERIGRAYKCPQCSGRLQFNATTMEATRAVEVVWDGGGVVDTDPTTLKEQTARSASALPNLGIDVNAPLVENPRTLAHPGMTTADLFTSRNWSILSFCAGLIRTIEDDSIRKAASLLLTASVAQCSRLIASRDKLTSGGPAWTVPGFWVPPIHLETNPAVHLAARANKFAKGLEELHGKRVVAPVSVDLQDAASGLQDMAASGQAADLIFLDPPYGDSVPYLEFSAMWNAFLGHSPSPGADIAVSDRKVEPSRWDDYAIKLKEVALAAVDVLSPAGKVLITFNNNDLRAWTALLSGLQSAGLVCDQVWYQIPAVVPSKAQFSPKGSYISDIYAVFRKGDERDLGSVDLVREALRRCAEARGGIVPRTVARRVLLIAWMENNLSAVGLESADDIILELLQPQGDHLVWKEEFRGAPVVLQDIVNNAVAERVSTEGCLWTDLYADIASAMLEYGVPDPWEIRECWGDLQIRSKKCYHTARLGSPTSTQSALPFFAPEGS